MDKTERLRLHFVYWVSILVMLLILVMTDRWTSQKDFTTYLSNAATMTSLVLGLVAIFYSFISNDGLSKSLGNISKISEEITESKQQLGKFLVESSELSSVGAKNTEALKQISDSLENHINSLQHALKSVSEQTSTLQVSVGLLPERFDKLEESFTETRNEIVGKTSTVKSVENDKFRVGLAKDFMGYSSIAGRFLTYACVLAESNGKEFSIDTLATELNSSNREYNYGYLVAMSAANLVDIQNVEEKSGAFKITRVDDTLKVGIREKIIQGLESKYKEKSPKLYKSYTDKLAAIEKHFQ